MSKRIDCAYMLQLNGEIPITSCCTCHESLYAGDEAYLTEDNFYYCPDCFKDMMDAEYKRVLDDKDIEYPGSEDLDE